MPYYTEDGKEYRRVSEWLSARTCEYKEWLHQNGDPTRPQETHAVVIPGTFGHDRIAKWICHTHDMEPPDPLKMNDGFRSIIRKWRKDGVIKQKLYDPVQDCFENFKQFWNAYEIEPVFVEKSMFYEFEYNGKTRRLAGTADLIARVKLKGTVDEDNMFHECNHVDTDPMCECEWHWVVTYIDWKYSKTPRNDHKVQLSVYHLMGDETGITRIASQNGKYPVNAENWSVLLKSSFKHDKGYQHYRYEQDTGVFFEAAPILDDPQPITLNHKTGNIGVGMKCSFCADRLSCQDVGIWTPKGKYSASGAVDLRKEEDTT